MWLYFNSRGQLLEYSEYDGQARSGTTNFKIYAYFKDIDITTEYFWATLKLYRPNKSVSSQPLILMEKGNVRYEGPDGSNFVHGETYYCYIFDFSSMNTSDESVILLDTPGRWYSVITLRSRTKLNVVGSAAFNVQRGIVTEEESEVSIDAILNYTYQTLFSGALVPYTGATNDVNLGNHGLDSNYIDTKILYVRTEDYEFELNSENSLTFNFNDFIRNEAAYVNFPTYDPRAGTETVAYQSWVQSQGYLTEHQSLAGYVPYSNATNDVNLGEHRINANQFRVSGMAESSRIIRGDISGWAGATEDDMVIENGDGNIFFGADGYIGYAGGNHDFAYIYRHTVTIHSADDTNEKICVVVYDNNPNAIDTIEKLKDRVYGEDFGKLFVPCVYIDQTDAVSILYMTDINYGENHSYLGCYFTNDYDNFEISSVEDDVVQL